MATSQTTAFDVRNLSARMGSELMTDIETPLSGAHAQKIRSLPEERGVLVIRGINLTDEQQIAFTKTIGAIVEEKAFNITMDTKENPVAEYIKGAFYWHIDGTTRLRDCATQPQFIYRHQWTLGDLVIWDNTGTMHHALAYAMDSGRMMHRTTLAGEEPFA